MNTLSKKHYLILVIFFIPMLASAQTWFQDGDHWVYRYSDGFSGTDGYCEMTVAGDTIIAGMNAKILQVSCSVFSLQTNSPGQWEYKVFGTEIDNKIYFINASDELSEVYDFNINEEDTYEYNLGAFQEGCEEVIDVRIDSLGSYNFENEEYQIQYGSYYEQSFDYTFRNSIYERIGSLESLLFIPYVTCLFDGPTFNLCQFKSSQDSIKFLDQDCYEVITSIKDISQNTISFGPNPSSSKITIFGEVHPDELTIYNLNGQLLNQHYHTKEIDVSTLQAGVYFIMISADGKKEVNKFIKY